MDIMHTFSRLVTNVVLNPLVLIAVALVTGIIGGLLVFDSPSYDTRRARAEQLAPISAAALADATPGREVLLEGHVSPRNQKICRDFVAYVREEYRSTLLDGTNDPHWVEVARVTPPLLVALTDGEAQIANNDYVLDTTAVTVEEAAPTVTKGAIQSRGYVSDSPVFAIGTVGAGGTLKAEFVYAGTRAAYIADMQHMSGSVFPVGIFFLLVCTFCTVMGAWQIRRFLREIAAERATEQRLSSKSKRCRTDARARSVADTGKGNAYARKRCRRQKDLNKRKT